MSQIKLPDRFRPGSSSEVENQDVLLTVCSVFVAVPAVIAFNQANVVFTVLPGEEQKTVPGADRLGSEQPVE